MRSDKLKITVNLCRASMILCYFMLFYEWPVWKAELLDSCFSYFPALSWWRKKIAVCRESLMNNRGNMLDGGWFSGCRALKQCQNTSMITCQWILTFVFFSNRPIYCFRLRADMEDVYIVQSRVLWTRGLPSGELTFCHGKSPFLMGKSTINGHFPLLC